MINQHRYHVMSDRRIRMAELAPADRRPLVNWRRLYRAMGTVLAVGLCVGFLWGLLIVGGA